MILKSLLLSFLLLFCSIYTLYSTNNECEIIDYRTKCTIFDDILTTEVSITIQINNRTAEKYAKIQIPCSNEHLSSIKAVIEDLQGNVIRKLKKKQIEDVSAFSYQTFYSDNRIKKFTLKHNVYPYRIKYSYTKTTSEFLFIANWYPLLDYTIPTKNASLEVITPSAYKIKHYGRNVPEAFTKTIDGNIHHIWQLSGLQPVEEETWSPPIEELIPYISVVPLEFKYGIAGSHESWTTFGNWAYKLNSGLEELPSFEKEKIKRLIDTIPSKIGKIKALYHYLQDNTRYINVAIDIGGLKSYPAEYVAKNKYGDCKALSKYMQAMLRYISINAYYTKIYAGNNPLLVNKDFPSQQFSHVCLFVPLENDTIWLECTDNIGPFGYFGAFTQNREALVTGKDNSHLVKTPTLSVPDVDISKKMIHTITASEMTNVSQNICFRGRAFDYFNHVFHEASIKYQEEIVNDIIEYHGFKISDWEFIKSHRDSSYINLLIDFEIPNLTKKYANNLVIKLYPLYIPDFETPQKRKLPLNIHCPESYTDTLIYELPSFYTIKAVPEAKTIENKFGTYHIETEKKENTVFVYRHFSINSGRYPVEKYPDFYKFTREVENTERNSIILIKP